MAREWHWKVADPLEDPAAEVEGALKKPIRDVLGALVWQEQEMALRFLQEALDEPLQYTFMLPYLCACIF